MPTHANDAKTFDILVIGSGAAGLTAALALAERHKVVVLAKGTLTGGSTAWAQGGIAAVLDEGDTFEEHISDTMIAGAGLNRRETVEFVIERAPHAIKRLIDLGLEAFIEPQRPNEAADRSVAQVASASGGGGERMARRLQFEHVA